MAKEQEGSIRKETGRWAIAGGIIAGAIGLLKSAELALLGAVLVAGGWYLRRD